MEDGFILGLSLRDYLQDCAKVDEHAHAGLLEHYMEFYQWFRVPRAHKVQKTTREASQIYELQTPHFAGKTFEECLPTLGKVMKGRMNWVWYTKVDEDYHHAKAAYPKATPGNPFSKGC